MRVHPDYEDIARWNMRETADFVYDDLEGDFTGVLIDAGYLSDDWRSARPKYYIEVKTTTSQCSTPFYMSGNQYRLVCLPFPFSLSFFSASFHMLTA